MKYRRTRPVYEAIRVEDALREEHPPWLKEAFDNGSVAARPEGGVLVITFGGTRVGALDDWITQDDKGYLNIHKAEEFELGFELIEW